MRVQNMNRTQIGALPRRRSLAWPVSRLARRGAAVIEGVVLLSVLLLLLFELFDFGLATVQYNTLSSVARCLARAATVHGNAASPQDGTWGPAEYRGNAGDNSQVANLAAPLLATMPPSSVAIDMQWPSGTNSTNDTVQVTLNYSHTPLLPFLVGTGALNLQAQSTMSIMH
jgi:Flp pilus assembly protein TadG